MKRKITIIAIIILIIIAFVVGWWFLARSRALKNGQTAPSFKEFIGIGTTIKKDGSGFTDNTSSSQFTDETDADNQNTPGPSGTKKKTIPVSTSIFTNGTLNPITTAPLDPNVGISGGSTTINTSPTTQGVLTASVPPAVLPGSACSDADVNIQFTPDEIAKLTQLKNRFFAVAETLTNDADTATEIANHDNFKSKRDKITGYYNYCVNSDVYKKAKPAIWQLTNKELNFFNNISIHEPYGSIVPSSNGPINNRVATPFWRDKTKDNNAFVHQGTNIMGIYAGSDLIFPQRSAEHAVRINLW